MTITKVNIGHIIGTVLSLTTSYQMWGIRGALFTFGLLMYQDIVYIVWEKK